MKVEDSALKRLQALVIDAYRLRIGSSNDQVISEEHRQECSGWLASAENLVGMLCPNPDSGYRRRVQAILNQGADWTAHKYVGEIAAILQALQADANHGLLASIADRARAETFDDFLDHAEVYYEEDRKNEASVIAAKAAIDLARELIGSELDS